MGQASLPCLYTSSKFCVKPSEVQRVEKADGVWRSDWRLLKKPWNADTFDQLDTGALRGISVGGGLIWSTLKIDNEDEASWSDPDSLLFSCDWILVEESLTAIPADVRAGVDRAFAAVLQRDSGVFDTIIGPEGICTLETPAIRTRLESLVRSHNESIAALKRQEVGMTTPTIPQEAIERAIADQLERSEALKSLTGLPQKMDQLISDQQAEVERNMEMRAKLDRIQFGGAPVLQLSNWKPEDRLLDLGKVLRLTQTSDVGFPPLDRESTTLEESVIERADLGQAGHNTVARIPWEALAERERQIQLQHAAMADAAGARPLMISVLGNAGLVLSSWSPVLARMDVRLGVVGGQKAPWATSQPTAAAAAEGADIPITDLVLDNVEYLPVSIASAYELTSSLRGVDDGTFEGIARMAIQDVIGEQVTSQVLVGGGTNEISGLWGLTGVQEAKYGAAQTDFTRQDALDFLDLVRLAKTDGAMYTGVLSTTLWKLAESKLRGGDASDMYLLEATGDGMGTNDGRRNDVPLRRPCPVRCHRPRVVFQGQSGHSLVLGRLVVFGIRAHGRQEGDLQNVR